MSGFYDDFPPPQPPPSDPRRDAMLRAIGIVVAICLVLLYALVWHFTEVQLVKLWLTVFGFLTLPAVALIVITGWLI